MREIFDAELKAVGDDLEAMAHRVEHAIASAGQALATSDLALAETVIADDLAIDQLERQLDERCIHLLAQQQPVATDLRVVVSALRMSATLERMGDLSVHVAKIARLRVPNLAVPADVSPTIERMAHVAEDMVRRVSKIITDRDVDEALALVREDEEMDQLRRSTFADMLSADWSHGVEAAVDVALLGRYYERIADHAVSVANRVVFVVTGENPRSVDA